MTELLNIFQELFVNVNNTELVEFFIRLIINIVSVLILIRYIYYPSNGQQEHLYTFFMMSLIVFLVACSLERVRIELGFALGLFAIFSIIRFRTPPFEMKEMTYLFTAIGISVINALVHFNMPNWLGMIISNVIILISAFAMEKYTPRKTVQKKMLTFFPSNLEILNSKKGLLEEIRQNTGIQIFRVEIMKINASKNEVTVWVYFSPRK